jgi:hypothetical protein
MAQAPTIEQVTLLCGTGNLPVVRVITHWPEANQQERSDLVHIDRFAIAVSLRDVVGYHDHGQVARATDQAGTNFRHSSPSASCFKISARFTMNRRM